jgi:NADH dehydrogenase FAD-containing subunit
MGPDSEVRGKREVVYTNLISQKGQSVYGTITEKLIERDPTILQHFHIFLCFLLLQKFHKYYVSFPFTRVKVNSISALQVQLDQAEKGRSFKTSTVWTSCTIFREKITYGVAIHF